MVCLFIHCTRVYQGLSLCQPLCRTCRGQDRALTLKWGRHVERDVLIADQAKCGMGEGLWGSRVCGGLGRLS